MASAMSETSGPPAELPSLQQQEHQQQEHQPIAAASRIIPLNPSTTKTAVLFI